MYSVDVNNAPVIPILNIYQATYIYIASSTCVNWDALRLICPLQTL